MGKRRSKGASEQKTKKSRGRTESLDDPDLLTAVVSALDGWLAHVVGVRSVSKQQTLLCVRPGLPHWWRPAPAAYYLLGFYARQCPGVPAVTVNRRTAARSFSPFPTWCPPVEAVPEGARPWQRLTEALAAVTQGLQNESHGFSDRPHGEEEPDLPAECGAAARSFLGAGGASTAEDRWVCVQGLADPSVLVAQALVLRELPGALDATLTHAPVHVVTAVPPWVPWASQPRPLANGSTLSDWQGVCRRLPGLRDVRLCVADLHVDGQQQPLLLHAQQQAQRRRATFTERFGQECLRWISLCGAGLLLRSLRRHTDDLPLLQMSQPSQPWIRLSKSTARHWNLAVSAFLAADQAAPAEAEVQLRALWLNLGAALSFGLDEGLMQRLLRGLSLRQCLQRGPLALPPPGPLDRTVLLPLVEYGSRWRWPVVRCEAEDTRALQNLTACLLTSPGLCLRDLLLQLHQATRSRERVLVGPLPQPLRFYVAAALAARVLCRAYDLEPVAETAHWPVVAVAPTRSVDAAPAEREEALLALMTLGHEALQPPHPLCAPTLGHREALLEVVVDETESVDLEAHQVFVTAGPCWGAGDRDTLVEQAQAIVRRLRALERKGAATVHLVLGGLECEYGFATLLSELADLTPPRDAHTCLKPLVVPAGQWLASCEVRISNSCHASWATRGHKVSPDALTPVLVLNAYAAAPRLLRLLMEEACAHAPQRPAFFYLGARPPASLRWRGFSADLAAVLDEAEAQGDIDDAAEPVEPLPVKEWGTAPLRPLRFVRQPFSAALAAFDVRGHGELQPLSLAPLAHVADLLFLPRVLHDSCRRHHCLLPDPGWSDAEWRWAREATPVTRRGEPSDEAADVLPVLTPPARLLQSLPALPHVARHAVQLLPAWQPLFH